MLAETDVDLRNAKLIALAGCGASENIYDKKDRVLDEMEKSMEAGEYSPLLFTLWRAYRCMYNEMNVCASKDCYSPNIRYNYYRRLVAHTILKYVEAHPDDYNNPNTACDAFFAALNSAAKAAPLMQLINKMDMDKLKQHILSLLPSYITYFERQSCGLFDIYHDLTAPSDENFQPIETKHEEGENDETAIAEDSNLPF